MCTKGEGPFFRRGRVAPDGPPDPRYADLFEFRQRLAEADARRASLRGGADAERALAELDVAWEELRTADEELRVQSEALDQATGSLGRERAHYQELFDFAPDPYVVTDAYGKIAAANRAASGLFNVPVHKLPGRLIVSFVRLGERSAFRERLDAVSRDGRPIRWETSLAPPSRREPPPVIAVAITAAPHCEGNVLWVLRDVGEKKRQEAALRSHNEALEQRVLERTSELEASRLALEGLLVGERESRRRSQEAGRRRDEFLALVSHELRSPLHALLGWARLAREGGDPETHRKAFEVIERNGRAMVRLLDDLIDAERAERGEFSLDKGRFDLRDLLSNLCASLQPGARSRGLSLDFEAKPTFFARVEGDQLRLEQAFSNLIANALKFTPTGGAVRLRLEHEGEWALVRVSDTGQGIAPALLPHVFERYRQGEGGGPQGARRGLGLGLALVLEVVTRHGGSVRAESEGEGRGATFAVRVPLADGVDDGRSA